MSPVKTEIRMAERVGFEPTVRENRTPDFESGPFDHSGTSPPMGCAFYYLAAFCCTGSWSKTLEQAPISHCSATGPVIVTRPSMFKALKSGTFSGSL